jgi:hypothetical protein
MRLTLLIPELLWSEPGDSDAWATADRSPAASLLADRPPVVRPPCAWEHSALDLAALPASVSLAALRAMGEAEPPFADDDPHWLCADPVHLRFHQDRLILADAADLALSADELAAISATLNQHLSPVRVHFPAADRGYLRLERPVAAAQRPLSQKVGCEVRPSDLGADGELRRLANEIQMLLYEHPVNVQREATRRPAVNALWLWGEGSRPAAAAATGMHWVVHGDPSPFVAGLARRTGGSISRMNAPLPRPSVSTVAYSDALLRAAQFQDSAAWSSAWQSIETDLLAPTMSLLRAGAIEAADIVAPTIFGELRWTITPGAARVARFHSFFRKPHPLSELADRLATNVAAQTS